jgi:acetoin utilization protein AcuB
MLAAELLSNAMPPVRNNYTIQQVIDRMIEFRVRHLPLVNEDQFVGLISEDDLIEHLDHNELVGDIFLTLVNPYVVETQHIYDVIRLFYEQRLTVVPVLDIRKNYLGLISIETMNEYFARITAVAEPGGIIVLEITNRNNSLAHMAQIVESDNAQVLSSYVRSFPDSTKLEVTLKLNKQDISGIVASFLRYDYTVQATFNYIPNDDDSMNRFDSFMNYLNL